MRAEQLQNEQTFTLAGAELIARGTGALWWPAQRLLVVSDLHLGKSERIARRGGSFDFAVHAGDARLRGGGGAGSCI